MEKLSNVMLVHKVYNITAKKIKLNSVIKLSCFMINKDVTIIQIKFVFFFI